LQAATKTSLTRRAALARLSGLGGGLAAGAATSAPGQTGVPGAAHGAAESVGELYAGEPGAWGRLSYYHFYLEAPDYLIESLPPVSTETRWTVPSREVTRLQELLRGAGLPRDQLDSLLEPRRTLSADGKFSVFPKTELLLGLTQSQRGLIYEFLAAHPDNQYHHDPVLIYSDSLEEWTEGTALPESLVELMRRLLYRHQGVLAFADVRLLLRQAANEETVTKLLKVLSRVRSMVARIVVDEFTDPAALLDYWTTGLGLRRKEIEPLLAAAARTRQMQNLDILHLLPPLARKLLFTYPDLTMGMDGWFPDCHWTTLNFFQYNPKPIYNDPDIAVATLQREFEWVEPPYQFGDVLAWVTPGGTVSHTCTYIASDLVFTKNGRNLVTPWILSHLRDIDVIYRQHAEGRATLKGMRKKPPEA
jgi:hypothetical protein